MLFKLSKLYLKDSYMEEFKKDFNEICTESMRAKIEDALINIVCFF